MTTTANPSTTPATIHLKIEMDGQRFAQASAAARPAGLAGLFPQGTPDAPVDLFRVFMSPEARAAALDVLTPDATTGRSYIGQGQRVDAFERALTDLFCSDVPLLSTNSCTSALDLALHLCGVGPGDLVISTPMTCSASNGGIVTRGARVVWADVDPVTGLIDPESVRQLVADAPLSRLKAIVAVDWAGRACDYNALRQIGDEVGGIPIIEDAAHAPLANYLGRPIAYMGGDYIAWSFGAIKHVTGGDGCGALRVPPAQVERARLLRWHGLDRTKGESFRCSQDILEAGYRYNLSDLNAAIGLANLAYLPAVVYAHRQHARFYARALDGVPGVGIPPLDAGASYWLQSLHTAHRDEFISFMAERGITTSQVHRRNDEHSSFRAACANPEAALPGLDAFSATQVNIPIGWWLSQSDLDRVVAAVKEWAAHSPGAGGAGS